MKCESSVITMTLYWHSSQVFNFGNCVDDTVTETGLIANSQAFWRWSDAAK